MACATARPVPPWRVYLCGVRMGRLGRLPPRVATLKPAVTTATADDESWRSATAPWRKWYKTARWQTLRLGAIWRDRATCAKCGTTDTNAASFATAAGPAPTRQALSIFGALLTASPTTWVADHTEPHRGDSAAFWDAGNIQCLCKPCHDRDKQREEAAARRRQR
jgi:5-methylcytosine-specific restriction enzyme A